MDQETIAFQHPTQLVTHSEVSGPFEWGIRASHHEESDTSNKYNTYEADDTLK